MHLDCVFSILGDKCCIMLEEMLGAESKTRRLVDEYSRHPSTGVLSHRMPQSLQKHIHIHRNICQPLSSSGEPS